LRVAGGRGQSTFSARHKAQSAYFTGLEPIWEIVGGLKITNLPHSPHPAARMMFGKSKLPASSRDFHDQIFMTREELLCV
jgi:hypothetical protein